MMIKRFLPGSQRCIGWQRDPACLELNSVIEARVEYDDGIERTVWAVFFANGMTGKWETRRPRIDIERKTT